MAPEPKRSGSTSGVAVSKAGLLPHVAVAHMDIVLDAKKVVIAGLVIVCVGIMIVLLAGIFYLSP